VDDVEELADQYAFITGIWFAAKRVPAGYSANSTSPISNAQHACSVHHDDTPAGLSITLMQKIRVCHCLITKDRVTGNYGLQPLHMVRRKCHQQDLG
jgi:hypothetical protein